METYEFVILFGIALSTLVIISLFHDKWSEKRNHIEYLEGKIKEIENPKTSTLDVLMKDGTTRHYEEVTSLYHGDGTGFLRVKYDGGSRTTWINTLKIDTYTESEN